MKRGLVLGGGGSRGAYQIGVWQALNELGMDFDIITGTSIGALNGALMVQGDFDLAKKMWEEITYSTVIGGMKEGDLETLNGATKLFKGFVSDIKTQGALDITPLEALVRKYLSEEKVRMSEKEYGFVTVEFPKIKEIRLLKKDIPKGMMADYLLASAACFPFFKTKVIDKTQYVDGGYRNNLPIDMAIKLGAEEIIAVDLENLGFIPKIRRFDVPVKFIRCYWSLGLFLNFDESRIRRNMTLGYLDTMRAFDKIEGLAYAFNIGETEKNYNQYGVIFEDIKKKYKENILDELKKPISDMLRLKIRRAILTRYNRKIGSPESIRRMAEIAGEVCGLPIAQTYYLDDFNEKLLETYEKISNEDFLLLEGILGEEISITEMTAKISQLDLRLVVAYIYRHVDNLLERGEKSRNLWAIAGIATNEFITAMYLYGLQKYKKDHA